MTELVGVGMTDKCIPEQGAHWTEERLPRRTGHHICALPTGWICSLCKQGISPAALTCNTGAK